MAARSISATAGKDAGPFDLFIAGLPRKYKWQDLKDLVKQQANHGIHTEIFNQFDNTGRCQGEARVLRSEEAYKLFRFLTSITLEGRHLHVHMFDLSNNSCDFVSCNCETGEVCPITRQRRSAAAMAPRPSRVPYLPNAVPIQMAPQPIITSRSILTSPYAPMPVPTMMSPYPADVAQLDHAMSRMYLGGGGAMHQDPTERNRHGAYVGATPHVRGPLQYAEPLAAPPMYLSNATGTLVNAGRGLVKTEARGVFVSNLKFRATAKQVEDYFSAVGTVIKVDLHSDPRTKKSKGYATILYADAGTAQRAIEAFDQRDFMGMPLKVRHDKETTVIGTSYPTRSMGASYTSARAKNPLIVDGSSAYAESDRQDSPLSAAGSPRGAQL